MRNVAPRCQSSLLIFSVWRGMLSAQMNSVVGRNLLNRSLCHNTNVDRIMKSEFGPHNIDRYAVTPQVDLATSALLG